MNVKESNAELSALKQEFRARDARMNKMALARTPGGLSLVYPDLFPNEGPYQEPMVANMVDVAARDTSEVLSPPPTLTCSSSQSSTDRARSFAEKRTKIAYGYFDASNLSVKLMGMADQYVTYGFAVGVVRPDFDRKTPVIQFIDPRGCYPIFDQWGETQILYEVRNMSRLKAMQEFPDLATRMYRDGVHQMGGTIEIVRRHAPNGSILFTPSYPDILLRESPNPTGESVVHVFQRPGLSSEMIEQFDDVLAVQVAKARFALLTLEAAQKSVQAPIAMPMDVQEMNIGPDATLRSQTPQSIQRVRLDVPAAAFAQQQSLDQELRMGARYPDVRTGNTDASVVTGRGVQALMTGFDSQIKTGQAVLGYGIGTLFRRAFAVDEALWPNTEKTLRGNANGTPYEVKYTPAKDIKGDHSIDVTYGLMAGLQPNQALVFGLQARGDKLISRDFLRKQMPFALDAGQEESKVDVEDLRDSLKEAVQMVAQAIPAMAQQGMDPSQILSQMSAVINARQKGTPVEQAVTDAFAPPPPPPEAAQPAAEDPMAAMMGGGPPPAGGMPGGVPEAPSAQMPQDVMQMMASLGTNGKAGLAARTMKSMPI